MVYTAAQIFEYKCPIEAWNIHQQTCDHIPRMNRSVETIHSMAHKYTNTNIHPSIWKPITPLMKKEILLIKRTHEH